MPRKHASRKAMLAWCGRLGSTGNHGSVLRMRPSQPNITPYMDATTAWISATHGSVLRMRPSQPNLTPYMDATTAWISVAQMPQPT